MQTQFGFTMIVNASFLLRGHPLRRVSSNSLIKVEGWGGWMIIAKKVSIPCAAATVFLIEVMLQHCAESQAKCRRVSFARTLSHAHVYIHAYTPIQEWRAVHTRTQPSSHNHGIVVVVTVPIQWLSSSSSAQAVAILTDQSNRIASTIHANDICSNSYSSQWRTAYFELRASAPWCTYDGHKLTCALTLRLMWIKNGSYELNSPGWPWTIYQYDDDGVDGGQCYFVVIMPNIDNRTHVCRFGICIPTS